jgi:DNA-binding XRE family transcriptional regulator
VARSHHVTRSRHRCRWPYPRACGAPAVIAGGGQASGGRGHIRAETIPAERIVSGRRRSVTSVERVCELRTTPGQLLAASRHAARLSQHPVASLADCSRSTIANAETGRQHMPRDLWARCDEALGTRMALARGRDEVLAAPRCRHLGDAAAAQLASALEARAHIARCGTRETQRVLGWAESLLSALDAGSLTGSAFIVTPSWARDHEHWSPGQRGPGMPRQAHRQLAAGSHWCHGPALCGGGAGW